MADEADRAMPIHLAPKSRRQVMTAGAVLAVSTAATLPHAAAAAARASRPDERLRSFEGAYVIADGRIVTGLFTQPRTHDLLDIIVLMPTAAGLTDALRDTARRHALGGALVVVPDLPATVADPAQGHDRMMAEVGRRMACLRQHPRSNGRLTIVAA